MVHKSKVYILTCQFIPARLVFQTENSEIDVDEDDEEDDEGKEEEEEDESRDLEDDSLEGPVSRGARPVRGGMRSPLLEESDNDF